MFNFTMHIDGRSPDHRDTVAWAEACLTGNEGTYELLSRSSCRPVQTTVPVSPDEAARLLEEIARDIRRLHALRQ